MPITIEEDETRSVIRLEGDVDIACSGELRRILIEAISSRKDSQVDLTRANELDVTAIQLLWAATREAKKSATSFTVAGQVPEHIRNAVCEAGFQEFPVPMIPETGLVNAGPSPAESVDDRQV